jgi:hypothetical protein
MPIIIDSNILLDLFTKDAVWYERSSELLCRLAEKEVLYINTIIYAEISMGFNRIEDLEVALPDNYIERDDIPYEAAFLAGKCFLKYRKSGGTKHAPLPDFYIGAHAAIRGWGVATSKSSIRLKPIDISA